MQQRLVMIDHFPPCQVSHVAHSAKLSNGSLRIPVEVYTKTVISARRSVGCMTSG